MATTTAAAAATLLRGIPEGEGEGSMEADRRSHDSGNTASASNSLRAALVSSASFSSKTAVAGGSARKLVSSSRTEPASSSRLENLFIGSTKRGLPTPSKAKANAATAAVAQTARSKAPHGAKHGSLRGYAEERLKAQELFEGRIARATDTGRLKWEAKTAILNNSYALAVLLLTRAGQLGSISACLSLGSLYTKGVTKGNQPVVVLVHRDPLLGIAWALEAARLLESRSEARARRGKDLENSWEQPAQIVSLFARLLRSRQANATGTESVDVPVVGSAAAAADDGRPNVLWAALCLSMAWLDQQLVLLPSQDVDDGASRGPDDDETDPAAVARLRARTHIALIEALVATRQAAPALRSQDDEQETSSIDRARIAWSRFAEALQGGDIVLDPEQGGLGEVAEAGILFRDSLGQTQDAPGSELDKLAETLQASLVEASVPVTESHSVKPASNTTGQLQSPSKRAKLRQRRSVEDLQSKEVKASNEAQAMRMPALLNAAHTTSTSPSIGIADAHVHGARLLFPRQRGFRANSLQEGGISARPVEAEPVSFRAGGLHRARRPSSIMSDSPSLLYAPAGDDDAGDSPPSSHSRPAPLTRTQTDVVAISNDEGVQGISRTDSVASSLWGASNSTSAARKGAATAPRKRVTSLYGAPSAAAADVVTTEGATTYDYDINASLQRQAARRYRSDSNASISTIASMLSTAPSIAESMAWEREREPYAQGTLASHGSVQNIGGYEIRLGGAADSLRRLRKTSTSSIASRDGPAAPLLTETLEKMIADSPGYRAANASSNPYANQKGAYGAQQQQALQRPVMHPRRNSNASLRSLSAFSTTQHRQTSSGLRSPIYGAAMPRPLSVFAMPIQASVEASPISPVDHQQPSAQSSSSNKLSALGSLRKLGGNASGKNRAAIPPRLTMTASALPVSKPDEEGTKSMPSSPLAPRSKATLGQGLASEQQEEEEKEEEEEEPRVRKSMDDARRAGPLSKQSQRAFASIDPTTAEPAASSTSHAGATKRAHEHEHSGTSSPVAGAHASAHPPLSPSGSSRSKNSINTLDPALARAEARSGLKTASKCSVCGKLVINGSITRTGEVFCGRDCRIEAKKRSRQQQAPASSSSKEPR
ncbi:hypothetical protein FA10DRAFT_267816 [Acaromyces ingoldii]|uniref:Uncharacterized protein n=1 Tax=Acaromyces ingoldii TaxID=215250 RepID=A0A316YKA6_9BASI|nr:hypothetical protein FA10DRAFT_267816 [Acaromyces ingoldii]PWN89244.1 hypothetical protein FA10DRAFT_267816 [Acaromyces ingoldii]